MHARARSFADEAVDGRTVKGDACLRGFMRTQCVMSGRMYHRSPKIMDIHDVPDRRTGVHQVSTPIRPRRLSLSFFRSGCLTPSQTAPPVLSLEVGSTASTTYPSEGLGQVRRAERLRNKVRTYRVVSKP